MADNNSEEKYDLYTEHIVPDKGKKIKRLAKRTLFVAFAAVVFGIVAGLVMIIVYREGIHFLPPLETREGVTIGGATTEQSTTSEVVQTTPEETDTKEPVTLPPTENTEEPETTTAREEEPTTEESETVAEPEYEEYRDLFKKIAKTQVNVTVSQAGADSFGTVYQSGNECSGTIIAENSQNYFILTSYSSIRNATEITIEYNNGVKFQAQPVSGDYVTDIAIISAPAVADANVKVAELGDSGQLERGSAIFAAGKIYGIAGAIGNGIITKASSTISYTDSQFAVINTNIIASEHNEGVICNTSGEIVGVINSRAQAVNINAFAISSIRGRIELLANGNAIPYYGVQIQEVTPEIQSQYGLPQGIYIASVEVGSPAYASGIQNGDIIVKIDREPVKTVAQVMHELSTRKAGDAVSVTVKRKGRDSYKEIVFNAVLGVQ